MIELRPYQIKALESVYKYWETKKGSNPCVICPTGSGKGIIIASLCKDILDRWPGTKIAIVTDSKELVQQDYDELKTHWPEAPAGIYSAGIGKRDLDKLITVGGIQSIYKHIYEMYPTPEICLIDECQSIGADGESRYWQFVKAIRECNPKAVFVGFSATPYRLSDGLLYEGKGKLFDGVAYEIKIPQLIKEGYLCPVISVGGLAQIDLTDVKIRGGEYVAEDLAYAADSPELISRACDEIIKYGTDRKSWLIFATSCEHADHITEELVSRGIDCETVTGETPKGERDNKLARFKDGKLRALTNVNLLIKGFNNKRLDMVVLMTATRSTAKFVQACGRVMRIFPGKENGLILDLGSNFETHGTLDNIQPFFKRQSSEKQDAPVKTCPNCRRILPVQTRTCPGCGHEWESGECLPSHGTTAYSGAVLTDQIKPEWINVRSVSYHRHIKEGKKDSLKIVYYSGVGRQYPVWCSLDHQTSAFAVNKARQWISQAGATVFTVSGALEEALSDMWNRPSRILVKPDGKYWQVMQADYSEPIIEQKELGVNV
jgi:DNA repair protein RadD